MMVEEKLKESSVNSYNDYSESVAPSSSMKILIALSAALGLSLCFISFSRGYFIQNILYFPKQSHLLHNCNLL